MYTDEQIRPSGLDELMSAIAEIEPDQRSRAAACFKEGFAAIDAALKAGKPFNRVLQSYNKAYRLTVSAPTFRKMLKEQRTHQEVVA